MYLSFDRTLRVQNLILLALGAKDKLSSSVERRLMCPIDQQFRNSMLRQNNRMPFGVAESGIL